MKLDSPKTILELSKLLEGLVFGDESKIITSLNRIEDAGEDEVTFVADSKYFDYLNNTKAGCVIVSKEFDNQPYPKVNFIKVNDPRKTINHLLNYLNEILKNKKSNFIHPTVVIGQNTEISKTAYIGANCVIGDNCLINGNVVIHPGCVLYDNVSIGKNTILNANVVCYDDVEIGDDCVFHSGAVIGADGFGFEEMPDGSYVKIPQLGNVRIGNRVEIGANTTVDRALLGSTIIEDGVKLDNLIMIAHNVTVGENTAMASQVGISGSTKIGKRNRIGGQTGMAGHLKTTDDVVLLARCGVAKSIDQKGAYFGAPARERVRAFKIEAVINNLPELKKEIFDLNKKVKEIENIKKSD